MIKADLHIHSTFSDGSDSIEEIIAKAENKGLDCIAITDHDTMSHLPHLPKNKGIKVLGGVELSAADKKNNLRAHILGYNIQRPELITEFARPLLEARNKNSERQAEILIRAGYKLEPDRFARADGKYLYKQHIMDQLVRSGQAEEMFGAFYKSIFKNGGICASNINYPDAIEAVKTIKAAGGQAVLAHSGQQQNFYLIPQLAAEGLDGLELNHHANSEKDKKIIRDYAKRYGLFLTGGSDYHGRYEPQPFGIGDFISDVSGVIAVCRE